MKFQSVWLIICFAYLQLRLGSITGTFCSDYARRVKHKFSLIRHCQRSNKTVIAFKNFQTVEQCADYARQSRGLAFNFGLASRKRRRMCRRYIGKKKWKNPNTIVKDPHEQEELFNCEILDCPEFKNFSSMVNDSRYDYYSLYSRPILTNSTCLPSIGVFAFHENRANYTMAQNTCSSFGGNLAHILSEIRTNMIANHLHSMKSSNTTRMMAFVGLNETEKNHFFTSSNEPLECFRYRAWSPGSPAKYRAPGCVAITTDKSWRVINCRKKIQFVCEILSSASDDTRIDLK